MYSILSFFTHTHTHIYIYIYVISVCVCTALFPPAVRMSVTKGPLRNTKVVTTVTAVAAKDLADHAQQYDTDGGDQDASFTVTTTTTTTAKEEEDDEKQQQQQQQQQQMEPRLEKGNNDDRTEAELQDPLEGQRKTRMRLGLIWALCVFIDQRMKTCNIYDTSISLPLPLPLRTSIRRRRRRRLCHRVAVSSVAGQRSLVLALRFNDESDDFRSSPSFVRAYGFMGHRTRRGPVGSDDSLS